MLVTEKAIGNELLPLRRISLSRSTRKESIVRDPNTGKVHFLNATATLVWECCDGKTTVSECEERLRAAFTIPDDVDVITDIQTTLSDFAKQGLIDDLTIAA